MTSRQSEDEIYKLTLKCGGRVVLLSQNGQFVGYITVSHLGSLYSRVASQSLAMVKDKHMAVF